MALLKLCMEQPPLNALGLNTEAPDHYVSCLHFEGHAGPHEVALASRERFGLVMRLQWIDAFPDFPRPPV